jgi:hypothetical protein
MEISEKYGSFHDWHLMDISADMGAGIVETGNTRRLTRRRHFTPQPGITRKTPGAIRAAATCPHTPTGAW